MKNIGLVNQKLKTPPFLEYQKRRTQTSISSSQSWYFQINYSLKPLNRPNCPPRQPTHKL